MSDTIDEATAAEPPADEAATEPDGSPETNGAPPDGAPRRRRRRGGRGRRGSGSTKKPSGESATEDPTDAVAETASEPAGDEDEAPVTDGGASASADGTPKPAARRRRRGGRGRGRPKSVQSSTGAHADSQAEPAGGD